MTTVHINWTRYTKITLPRIFCFHCDRKTDFVTAFQEWYGWSGTCLNCGERFQDDEWIARPFQPRWRKENIAEAKALWATRIQRLS